MAIRQQSGLISPIIPANRTIPFQVYGRFFHLVDAPTMIGVKLGEMPEVLTRAGTGYELTGDDTYQIVEIRNPTSNPIKISMWIGFARYHDYRIALIEPETEIDAWSGTQIDASSGEVFLPDLSGTRMRRKAIQVTNGDATSRLQLRDAAGNVALEIFPETSITQPISGYVEVFNPNGAPVSCRISEIYWVG